MSRLSQKRDSIVWLIIFALINTGTRVTLDVRHRHWGNVLYDAMVAIVLLVLLAFIAQRFKDEEDRK